MRLFWPIYLITAVVSTAGVYCFSPLARPYVAHHIVHDEAIIALSEKNVQRASAELPDVLIVVSNRMDELAFDESLDEEKALFENDQGNARLVTSLPARFETSEGLGEGGAVNVAEAQPTTGFLPQPPSSSEGSINDERICSPAELGIHLVSRGDLTPVWCIVCRQAEYYMMDGLSSGFFPAGKILDYRNTHDSRQGAMVEIMADSPGGIPTTPFLVSQTNLSLFAGDYRELTAQQLQEMKTRYGQTGTNLDPSESALPPGVRLVLRGDQSPAWGIVRQQANRYRMDGSWAGVAESATVVDCQKTVSTSRGPAVDCLLHSTNSEPPSHALVAWEDLHLFTGSYKSLSEKQRIDLRNYYEMTGKILSRKNELLKKAAEKNPHQAAYQASYRALLALVEKTQAEVIRRDHSADAEKVRAQERLFRIRMEERRLRNDYETAASNFYEWKKLHAAELNLPENDSAIAQWKKQKRPYQFMSSLAGLIY